VAEHNCCLEGFDEKRDSLQHESIRRPTRSINRISEKNRIEIIPAIKLAYGDFKVRGGQRML
jgi:hypothetical protein